MSVAAIVPAAGKGRRFGPLPKLFVKVGGRPVLYYTLKNLSRAYPFHCIVIASDPAYFKLIDKIARSLGLANARIVKGGETRAESVRNALLAAAGADWALVHDAARPMVTPNIVRGAIAVARKRGGAVAALPATATVKRAGAGGKIIGTEDRESLYLAQTPQVFRRETLLDRYKKLKRKAFLLTDEAAFFDGTNTGVWLAPGSPQNLKITTAEDLDIFKFYLKRAQNKRG